jgi:hypothetical protein
VANVTEVPTNSLIVNMTSSRLTSSHEEYGSGFHSPYLRSTWLRFLFSSPEATVVGSFSNLRSILLKFLFCLLEYNMDEVPIPSVAKVPIPIPLTRGKCG